MTITDTGKKIYFISDLHLGSRCFTDPAAKERVACEFLRSIKDSAEAVYLLGDILDYWYEYRTVVPRGFVRFFGTLAELADYGVKIKWYIGNHDIWLFDYLRNEIGITIIDGYTVEDICGKRFFLSHGDGVGRLPSTFRLIRSIFRNRFCQKLYSAIHPRWTVPFAFRWSASNRGGHSSVEAIYNGADKEPQAIFAREYLRDVDPGINYFIFGHRHVIVQDQLSPDCQLIILGDWISRTPYAEFDGNSVKMKEFLPQTPGININ